MSADQIRRALRSLMGNVPGPEGGIEDTWRAAKAYAIDRAVSLLELAVDQAHLDTIGVLLYRWEGVLGLLPVGDDATRLAAVVAAELEESRADFPSLEAELQAIDPNLSLTPPSRDTERVVQAGRFLPQDAQNIRRVATFADAYVWRVRYALGAAETIPASIRAQVDELMQKRIASWESYVLLDDNPAFLLDGGPANNCRLDQTAIY